jgi:hypothetical protein
MIILNSDFTTSSFDAILHPIQLPDIPGQKAQGKFKLRSNQLPHLLPFVQLITDKCGITPLVIVIALIYVKRFRATLPAGKVLVYLSRSLLLDTLLIANFQVIKRNQTLHIASLYQVFLLLASLLMMTQLPLHRLCEPRVMLGR